MATSTVFFVILSLGVIFARGEFSWGSLFFASEDEASQEDAHKAKEPKSQFELSADQDRFIQAHGEYFDLPDLDRCLHEAVERLSSSCRDMPEEELGKLTVWLYNCHAQSEGRTTFICSNAMSLAECTSPMSESAWGTYQTISNRARAFCYRMSQEQFARKVELSVNQLTGSAISQLQSMHDLQKLTNVIMGDLNSRTDEMRQQQEQNVDSYEHLRTIHEDALSKVRERLSLYNDLYQQTFDRTLSFYKFVENMTQVVNISAVSQSLELTHLGRNVVQIHKQLLTFNATMTRWFFQLADRINRQLSDIETEAAALVKSMEMGHSGVMEQVDQILDLARVLNSTLHDANGESVKKGFHLTAIPDHLTLLFLTLTLSLLFEPSRLMKFIILCSTSIASSMYISDSNPIYLSFVIILIPLVILSEYLYVLLFVRRKKTAVVAQRSPQPLPPNSFPQTHPYEYSQFTTSFKDHPIFEATLDSNSRETSPAGSVTSSASNAFNARCSAVTRSGLACRRHAVVGDLCNQHYRQTNSELS